jgi:hypothetical protein
MGSRTVTEGYVRGLLSSASIAENKTVAGIEFLRVHAVGIRASGAMAETGGGAARFAIKPSGCYFFSCGPPLLRGAAPLVVGA